MIGDIILWFKNAIKQHITCRHIYKHYTVNCYGGGDYEECTKCGKWRD